MRRPSAWLALPLLAALACTDAASRPADAADAVAAPTPPAADPSPAAPGDGGAAHHLVVQGIELTGVGYDKGTPGAPITVVEFSDFGCGYCAKFTAETEPALMAEFVATGQVYWKYVPFVMGMFPNAPAATRAAECAAEQGAFWAVKDSLYAGQRAWRSAPDPAPAVARLAVLPGMDQARFAECYRTEGGGERTRRANDAARRLGVRATPTFFINGQMVEGALPLNVFRGGLRQMLESAG